MKKIITLILSLLVINTAFAQTVPALPSGAKPYGNQLYITPSNGLIYGGNAGYQYRVLGTKQYVDSTLAYKQYKFSITPEEFGAKGDGLTDDTQAIQDCLDAIPISGGQVTFSSKKYIVNGTLTVTNKTSLVGVNGNMQRDYSQPGFPFDEIGTILQTNSGTSTLLLINAKACDIFNMQIKNASLTTPTAGNGIYFTNAGGFRLSNSSIYGFYTNLKIEKGVLWKVDGAFIASAALYNVHISTSPSFSDFGDGKLINSWLVANANTNTNLKYESSSGLTVANVKFITSGTGRVPYHIDINNNLPLSDVNISNCSFESFSTSAIRVRPINTGFLQELQILNNQFAPFADLTSQVIDIYGRPTANNLNVMVNSNTFYNSNSANNTNSRLPIKIDSSFSVSVHNNNYFGWNNRLSVTNSNDVDTLTNYKNVALLNKDNNWFGTQTYFSDMTFTGGSNLRVANGFLQVGPTSFTGANIVNSRNMTGAVSVVAMRNAGTIQSDVTTAATYLSVRSNVSSGSFTLPSLFYNHAAQNPFGAGATVTNQYAYFVDPSLIGATNNFGYYAGIPAGTGRWNFYGSGSAQNYMAGSLGLGINVPTEKIDVVGNGKFSGTVLSSQYRISSLNTAPASATATGTLGEIRITSTFIYICTATNTWVRAALSTW